MAVQIGSPAPAFELYDSDKNAVRLEDQRGKNVVLLFFPLAFTGVCTRELCTVRDDIAAYNNTNARVFGISVDSLYVLNKFREEQHLNFALLSDFNREVSRAYDVLYENFPPFGMRGVSKRAAFIVDAQGILRYAEICTTPRDLPNFEALQKVLAASS